LDISHEEYFAICVQYPTGPRSSQILLIEPEKHVCQVLSEISAQQFHFLLRFAFLPADMLALLETDLNAFLYLYQQTVNDVVVGRFIHTMRYDMCIRLAAVQMLQTVSENGGNQANLLKEVQ
ncbi:hypothetical protein D918_08578, partial [Trichuris suis]